jgi:hypothetical protein
MPFSQHFLYYLSWQQTSLAKDSHRIIRPVYQDHKHPNKGRHKGKSAHDHTKAADKQGKARKRLTLK